MGRADLLATGLSEAELGTWLPAGSVIEPLGYADGRIVVPGAKPGVSLRAMDLSGLASGMLALVDGRAPHGTAEVAISASVARLAGVGLGGEIVLDGSPPATVVGLVENETYLGDRLVLVDPHAVEVVSPEFGTWLVGLPAGADAQAIVDSTIDPETGGQDVIIQSRESSRLGSIGGDGGASILVLGALALVEAALIASAAFAVSIRRRQRELGLLAATGATPRQLAGTVVAGAAMLGVVASILGVAVGLLGAFALTPWLDQLTDRRNGPLVIDTLGLVGPVLIGFAAAMIAAVVPARTAASVPVLLSLSGRRPPVTPARRTLQLGLAAVVLSIAMTLVGANLRLNGSETLSLVLMIGGAVLGTLGFGGCGPWLLERLDGLAVRLPLAGRIAFRDAARSRSRSSPIVTAVLASFAATVALGTWTVSRDAANTAEWQPWLHPDQLVIRGSGAEAAGSEVAKSDGAIASAAIADLMLTEPAYFWIEAPGARDGEGNPMTMGIEPYVVPYAFQDASIATPELLAIVHAESAAADLAAGKVIILSEKAMTADAVEIVLQEDPNATEPTGRVRLPASVVVTGISAGVLPGALLPASVAGELGLGPWPEPEYVIQLDHPVTEADVSRAAAIAERFPDTFADASLGPDRPGEGFRMVLIALALLLAVSVMGIATALGEAESRPEQRSLLALGAEPGLRRRISAARVAVLALLAGILAVPAGLLPVWGLLASREAVFVVPVLEVAASVLALPLLAIAASWLLSRPIPDWSAFRSIGASQ
jgi:putative ABC transport system permease protein